ncbi:MAG: hypothetical protein HRU28_06170, partial [Rhizobiales bacterium]|nr:hypothetical protein [Hyphomicrobiales bacterium]
MIEEIEKLNPGHISGSFNDYIDEICLTPFRVAIKYIENDVLDIEAASSDPIFDFLQGAEFIFEDDGTYICGH